MQGVGFRPYVHRLAGELGLAGFVLNDERGVLIEVEGDQAALDAFVGRLAAEAPPLAQVERVLVRAAASRRGEQRVRDPGEPPLAASRMPACPPTARPATTAWRSSSTPPTAATATRSSTAPTAARASRSCGTCPTTGRSRRWPAFAMCAALPRRVRGSRRPALSRPAERLPRLRAAAAPRRRRRRRRPRGPRWTALASGSIVAVKGLGGYHLACRAESGAGGGGAALAQAEGGPALRPDGALPGGRARAGATCRPPMSSCCRVTSGRS